MTTTTIPQTPAARWSRGRPETGKTQLHPGHSEVRVRSRPPADDAAGQDDEGEGWEKD